MLRIADHISRQAHRHPNRPAVSFGGDTFSWATFEKRCWGVATLLFDLGVRAGDRVAYLGLNSHRYFECYYAPSRIGAILVPLNIRLSVAELVECVADCTPKALIMDPHLVHEARSIASTCPSIEVLVCATSETAPEGMHAYDPVAGQHPSAEPDHFTGLASQDSDTIVIFYTSGTTGRAKGVMLSHSSLFTNAIGVPPVLGLKEGETHLLAGPMFHLGAGSRVYSALMLGAHTVILPRFDVVEVLNAIEKYRIQVLVLVPTMLAMLLEHPRFRTFDLSSLRLITYGAAPMPIALLERAMSALPDIQFGQAYGMTEVSPVLTVLTPEEHDPMHRKIDRLTSVGRPLTYVDLRVVDSADRVLEPGNKGEIIVRGPNVMNGYWKQPELTAEVMRGGFFHTGDVGYLDEDGFVYLAGRLKEMIITGAENVYPIETENVLSQHPAVAACAVFGLPDDFWGETVHAVVTLNADSTTDEDTLIEYCRAHLAHFKCPRSVSFRSEAMPLSSSNKIDKSVLKQALLDPR